MCAVFGGSSMAATRRRCLSSLLLSIHEAVCLSSSSLPRAQVNWRESGRRRRLPSWLVRYGRIPTRFKMTRVGPWPNQASKLGASVVHGRTLALCGSSYYHVAVYRIETRYSYIINGQAISKRMYIIRWRVLKILQSNLIAQFLAVPFCTLTFSRKTIHAFAVYHRRSTMKYSSSAKLIVNFALLYAALHLWMHYL